MEWLIVAGVVLGLLFLPRLLRRSTTPADTRAEAARQRVQQIKYFYIHLGFYLLTLLVGGLLIVLVGVSRGGVIAFLLWTLALALHGFVVFVVNGRPLRDWEDRQMQKLMDKRDT